MKNLGYYNGKYDELEKMQIPMLDRVCFFGDGVYDATYCCNYAIHDLKQHVDRFYRSADILEMEVPMCKRELTQLLCDLVKKVDSHEQFVYFQLTRGTGVRNHVYPDAEKVKGNLWVVLTPKKVVDTYKPVKLITREDTRFLHCNAKTVNLIPACMGANAAHLQGADECVFHRGDEVTECAHSNVHIIKDGKFITHPADEKILCGISRLNLLDKCSQLGIPIEERAFTVSELFDADEVIISSCGSFCLQATEIDGKAVGGKAEKLLRALQDGLVKDFNEECGISV